MESLNAQLKEMRRKEDKAWEMAGLARQDGDARDEARYTKEALKWQSKAAELRKAQTS